MNTNCPERLENSGSCISQCSSPAITSNPLLVPTPVSDTKLPHRKIQIKYSAVKSWVFCFKDLNGKLAKLGLQKIKPGNMKIRESSHRKFLYNLALEGEIQEI